MNPFSLTTMKSPTEHSAQPAAGEIVDALRTMLLDEIECGLIVCDGRGMVLYANHTARQEMASGRLLRRAGDLLCTQGGSAGAVEGAVRGAVIGGRRQTVRLSQGSDRLLVSVTPLRPAGSTQSYALLVLGRRRPCSELGLEMLAGVYGLTWAERRVMAGLVRESTAREIAQENAIALSTVRTQIQSLRNKFGARTIDGLLLRIAEVPPVASALRLAGDAAGMPPHERREGVRALAA
jgi:DNA-binding CsgD family transcriptional regulator